MFIMFMKLGRTSCLEVFLINLVLSVFESYQFVLTKGGTFVGKGYPFEGVFKLNLVNKVNVSVYMIDLVSLWHNRLGHVNTRNLRDMFVLNLIPNSVNDDECIILYI
jgi:hypothetical protein